MRAVFRNFSHDVTSFDGSNVLWWCKLQNNLIMVWFRLLTIDIKYHGETVINTNVVHISFYPLIQVAKLICELRTIDDLGVTWHGIFYAEMYPNKPDSDHRRYCRIGDLASTFCSISRIFQYCLVSEWQDIYGLYGNLDVVVLSLQWQLCIYYIYMPPFLMNAPFTCEE